MNIALVTCTDLPGWEKDDRPLHAELGARGITFDQPAWDGDVDWSAYDAALIRTTWDYMPRRDAFVAWAKSAGEQTQLFNSADVIRWNTHKGYLRELAALGVPIAPTVWAEPGQAMDVAAEVKARGWRRGFIKPVVGACAVGTLRFDSNAVGLEAAQAHVDALLAAGEGVMLQPYLARVEVDGELSAICFDGVVSHAVQKIPVPGDYRVQDDHGATDHPVALTATQTACFDQVLQAAHEVVPGLGGEPLLYARIDLMWDDAGDLCVTELELVEPSLFFRHGPDASRLLVDALMRRID
ncbi:MAG: ATP-grasp domain-containing protein [Myxococcota bacterium]